ncbi:Imidazolonepropionase [Planctomycetes bacterium Pla163]|uniref:Imidazolonepropionase n=1 Tax=Rohdeia mirabilis TaxID=2528008 RepID=A0A518D1Z0_9BACT|nr:Imidazolonepropionase [Planctomycetes bacterium Pla163]
MATPRGSEAVSGAAFGRVDRIAGGAVAIDRGRVVAVGTEAELAARYEPRERLDARGGLVVPGFVDAHTHPVFAGTREAEFEMRTQGASYAEIALAGGGILSSLRGVRETAEDDLVAALLVRLDRFLEQGTTTVEAKSGYGLDTASELKSLRAIARAGALHPVDLVPTFLGAHAFPPEFADDRAGYVDLLVDEMLPAVAESGLASYADIFTETHTFGLDDSRRIMRRAQELGLGLRMHVDQLTPLGGADLAAELAAATADHCEHTSDAALEAMARAHVQPVLCPLVPLYLREEEHEAPAARMLAAGLAPVVSTDFNPGSCYTQSMTEVLTWSALRYRFSATQCLVASTLNAAVSVGRGARAGTFDAGKDADLLILDVPNLEHLVYEFGRNPVRAVLKRGRLVCDRTAFVAERTAVLERVDGARSPRLEERPGPGPARA